MSDYTEDWHGQEAREEAESRTRGEAMSTADDAWQEWFRLHHNSLQLSADELREEAFMAGYRRALEDAADEYDRRADRDKDAIGARANVAIVCRDHAAELRALAAGLGTKDGADDE